VTAPIAIGAASEPDARRLVEQLTDCHCWIIRSERDGWTVRAEPWRNDPASLRDVLSTVASWVGDTATGTTEVTLDGRSYTLAAEEAVTS